MSELARMVRVASREVAQVPGGSTVIGLLIRRLWLKGGIHALEGAQIAWECRDAPGARDELVSSLADVLTYSDFGVRRIALSLSRLWCQRPYVQSQDLPGFYTLAMPPNPEAAKFEPPSGNSATSHGLWTDDWLTRTSSLGTALNLTAKASNQPLPVLRARAALIMEQMGGKEAFGPPAVKRQLSRMDLLDLHAPFRKLAPAFAFVAMRTVIGELVAARRIDPRAVPLVMHETGVFPDCVATVPPSVRPSGVGSFSIPDLYRDEEWEIWRKDAQADVVMPQIDGYHVLAATTFIELIQSESRPFVERYAGPDLGHEDKSLWSQLQRLEQVVITDGAWALYDGHAPGAVVHPRPDIARSVHEHSIMLCPHVAASVGWKPDRNHVFTYRNSKGDVVAETLLWRDGGAPCRDTRGAVSGYGYVLAVKHCSLDVLKPYLASKQLVRAWRGIENVRSEQRVSFGASGATA